MKYTRARSDNQLHRLETALQEASRWSEQKRFGKRAMIHALQSEREEIVRSYARPGTASHRAG